MPGSALAGDAAGPSPLLNAPPVDGWQPVPGARPVAADGSSAMQPRIINGDIDSGMKLFPYVAFVSWRLNSSMSSLCSGSLIGPSHVLTAAHVSSGCRCRFGVLRRAALPAMQAAYMQAPPHPCLLHPPDQSPASPAALFVGAVPGG